MDLFSHLNVEIASANLASNEIQAKQFNRTGRDKTSSEWNGSVLGVKLLSLT